MSGILACFGAAGTQRNSGPRFPALGVPNSKKKLPRYPGWLSTSFLHFYLLPDRTPMGGKSRNTEFLGPFGLWHGRGLKTQKHNFLALGVPKSKKKRYHAIRDGCPQLFYILRFGRLNPQGREIAKYWGFRPLVPRHREIPGRKKKNAIPRT